VKTYSIGLHNNKAQQLHFFAASGNPKNSGKGWTNLATRTERRLNIIFRT